MPRPQDDDFSWGSEPGSQDRPPARRPDTGGLNVRMLTLAGGFALAVAATLAVFLTDNRQYLRIAVVAVAWAFVLATFAAGRRGADRATAAAREAQLRHAYELELEREVAARREYELELEHDLRRETEDVMRHELDALRSEITSLARLRDEVARVSDLRHDITNLRDDVSRVAALREDVAALTSLRQDLGQLSELRADLARLRTDLTEQLSSEMLVERIVMRTQGGRLGTDQGPFDAPGRPGDTSTSWSGGTPPRELTGGWPAIRLDDPRESEHVEQVRADRAVPSRHTAPAAMWSASPLTSAFDLPPAPQPQPTSWSPETPGSHRSRHSDDAIEFMATPGPSAPRPVPPRPVAPPAVPPTHQVAQSPSTEVRPSPSPRPSPHPRPRPTPPAPSARPLPDLPPLRRRDDGDAAARTAERPVVAGGRSPATGAGNTAAPSRDAARDSAADGQNDNRLAELLAENGVSPSTGSRRRRRYREDGEPDDVLARVLGLG